MNNYFWPKVRSSIFARPERSSERSEQRGPGYLPLNISPFELYPKCPKTDELSIWQFTKFTSKTWVTIHVKISPFLSFFEIFNFHGVIFSAKTSFLTKMIILDEIVKNVKNVIFDKKMIPWESILQFWPKLAPIMKPSILTILVKIVYT